MSMLQFSRVLSLLVGAVLCISVPIETLANAALPRVLPKGQLPNDQRLGPLKTLRGAYPFTPSKSPKQWATRSERVRRQVLVATGLWPMPTKTPANAVVHGRVECDGYTVEKVYLESYPGHFVTGNLYRPKGDMGARPGVLCPHGHWAGGRFHDAGEKKTNQQVANGAERFKIGGRSPFQARSVQLARMGCVVFHYDMIGYADSQQLQHRLGMRDAMNSPRHWGFFSPQATARLQNIVGLQTYNSTRVLDWFSSLSDVDPQRIAVTGASGGGTQTYMLGAIDPRPAVAFPAVMVSTVMQGTCMCENACYLRIGTGNVELAALFAPRPLGMTAANDWTRRMSTQGLPELRQLYKMFGREDCVMVKTLSQFKHNINSINREVMYRWVNKHLKLGHSEPIVEKDYKLLSTEEMSVWNDKHPQPIGGDDYERSLLNWMTEDSKKQMAALVPKDSKGLAQYRHIVGGAVDVMIGRPLSPQGAVTAADVSPQKKEQTDNFQIVCSLLRHAEYGEEIPVIRLVPKSPNRRALIWIDKQGKQTLFDDAGNPRPAIRKLLDAGFEVVGVDLFGQGEFTKDGKPLTKVRLLNTNKRGRSHVGYTFCYNHPVFSKRVHDILSVVSYLRDRQDVEKVDLVGLGGAGHWVAAARAQADDAVDRAVIDTARFRFADLTAVDDPDFLPGGAKYLDLPGMIALSAPHAIWLAGEETTPPPTVAAAYKAAGNLKRLTLFGDKDEQKIEAAAMDWLLTGIRDGNESSKETDRQ